jgi:hypothetical protein
LAATIEPLRAAFGTHLTALAVFRRGTGSEEFGTADLAVSIGIKLCEARLAGLSAIARLPAAHRTLDRLGFLPGNETVAVDVDASECLLDSGLDLRTGHAGTAIEAAAILLGEGGSGDEGGSGGAR